MEACGCIQRSPCFRQCLCILTGLLPLNPCSFLDTFLTLPFRWRSR